MDVKIFVRISYTSMAADQLKTIITVKREKKVKEIINS